MFPLNTPVENLYLVGPARAKLFKNLGINNLNDLLYYFPRTHHDLSKITPLNEIKADEFANVKAKVLEIKSFRTKIRRFTLTQALIEDHTGNITCVWFNQPFLNKVIKPGEYFLFSGKVVKTKGKLQLQSPVYEQEKQEQVHTARLVPIYSLTANLTQKQLRGIIKNYLDKIQIPEYLPLEIIREEKLLDENTAIKHFHFPATYPVLKMAQKRLAFDEIFQTQLRVLKYKKLRQTKLSFKLNPAVSLKEKLEQLPFTLTNSQKQALEQILEDFQKDYPANRLLEGDVGSGKTIIAALSMFLWAKSGLQCVLLAPTEVLAQQHYINLLKLFLNDQIDLGLLTSAAVKLNGNPVSRETLLARITNGKTKIIIGTHSLLEKEVKFKNLALVIIDEQHRFGVQQRSLLKQAHNAHLLTMSATPIPRTLALTLYGDLDISVLTELPSGRKPIQTTFVPEHQRSHTYEFIAEHIKNGRQAFVVCPLIEESDKLGVKSATLEYKKLTEKIFPQYKIGLLHGKLKPAEKEKVMQKFKDNEYQILVSTSVIEVGVDVPNATIMIIEGSERFGLAQLHQFRGRVGRSDFQSYCFLFSDNPDSLTNPRLQAMIKSNNGFELAEKDLQIRGSGDLYGTRQSGYSFRIATLANLPMVEKSRTYAQNLLEEDIELKKYPLLQEKINQQPQLHLE